MARTAVALAPAKINLGLEVLGRRPDGYHEIASILQTISIFDRFVWRETAKPFEYISPGCIDEDVDLVNRALQMSPDRPDWRGTLRLEKAIPVSAGLGGGSSDAALALQLARQQCDVDTLRKPAAIIGSDVPFFLTGGTVLASGSGTQLLPLPTPDMWCVIVTPHLSIPAKTKTLYSSLGALDLTDGNKVINIAGLIRSGATIKHAPPNAFTRALLEYPEVRRAQSLLEGAGAPWVSVSGAGPSLFTLVRGYHEATAICRRLPNASVTAFIARTIPANSGRKAVLELSHQLRRQARSR